MAKLCKFIDGVSISVTATGFRLLGDQGGGNLVVEHFIMHEAAIDELVGVAEGIVHALLVNGALYEIAADYRSGFVVRKLAE